MDFICEYVKVMKPLTEALDVMQNEENIAIGCMLPVINLVKSKLGDFQKDKTIKLCQPLLSAIQLGIEKRFGNFFYDSLLQLAAVSDPHYKTIWIKDAGDKESIITLLKDEVSSQLQEDYQRRK